MFKLVRIFAVLSCVALMSTVLWGQTTYTWNVASGDWTSSSNWNPTRSAPATNDVLVFDGSTQATATVTLAPRETIGRLRLINNAAVTISTSTSTAGAGTLVRSAAAVTGTGTAFTTLFSVGDFLFTATSSNLSEITAIADDTHLTTAESGTIASAAYTRAPVITITGNQPGLDIQSGSTLTVSSSTPTIVFLKTGSTGSISGGIVLSGVATRVIPVDASSLTFNSGSTMTANSSFLGNAFGTIHFNASVFASGSVYVQVTGSNPFGASAPNGVAVFQAGSLLRQDGNLTPSFSGRTYANFEYNVNAANTTTGGSAVSINNLTITQGTLNFNMTGTPGHSIKGNISVANGATLTFSPASAGTVNLNGSSQQTISGAGTISASSLSTCAINNSNGVLLSRSFTHSGVLSFTSGKLTLDAGVTLTLASTASISGASSSNYIVADISQGSDLRRNAVGASNVVFPIGLASSYNPVTINNAGTAADYRVGVQSTFDVAPPNAAACVNRQWNITETSGGPSNSTLTFQWNTADEGGSFNRTGAVVIGTYPSSWQEAAASYTDLGGGVYTASASGYSAFNPFAVGNAGALPVQLVSFSAKATRLSAELSWSTATEMDCYGFEVERRSMGAGEQGGWAKVGFVRGAGTSSSAHEYAYNDQSLQPGRYAYRIKQVDQNGTFSYYGNAEVEIGLAAREFKLESAYPNPFNPSTNIEFVLAENGHAGLKVFNLLGQQVATLFDQVAEAGKLYTVRFDASQLPTGIYFARLEAGNQRAMKKLLYVR